MHNILILWNSRFCASFASLKHELAKVSFSALLKHDSLMTQRLKNTKNQLEKRRTTAELHS
ncbi:hypothetical protein JHK82_040105 [Glycine max]|nr:hypothetical protein JHK82_040105 [Glycine max]